MLKVLKAIKNVKKLRVTDAYLAAIDEQVAFAVVEAVFTGASLLTALVASKLVKR